jgi:hypothetical protein
MPRQQTGPPTPADKIASGAQARQGCGTQHDAQARDASDAALRAIIAARVGSRSIAIAEHPAGAQPLMAIEPQPAPTSQGFRRAMERAPGWRREPRAWQLAIMLEGVVRSPARSGNARARAHCRE